MADDKTAENEPEQSMEDILASIRKIISEDDEDDASAAASAEDEDDILDLGDPLPDDEFDEVPADPEPVAAAPEPAADMGIDDEEDDELIVEEMAAAAPEPEPEAEPDPEPEPDLEPEPKPEPEVARAPEPPPPPPQSGESLVSAEAAALTAAALSSLRAGGVRGDMAVGDGNSLEGLVRELLRPMLKQWLDVHLPSMVENLVREEIQRIQRQGRE